MKKKSQPLKAVSDKATPTSVQLTNKHNTLLAKIIKKMKFRSKAQAIRYSIEECAKSVK